MLNRKPLIIAAIAATMGVTVLSTQAYAHDDALLGAIVGAGIGAAIGHNVHGRDGAAVGGAIGAIAGASIAASSQSYYDSGYYAAPATVYAPAPVYYGGSPAYYQSGPVYYPRRVEYAPRVDYVYYDGGRHVDHNTRHGHDHWDRRGSDRQHGH